MTADIRGSAPKSYQDRKDANARAARIRARLQDVEVLREPDEVFCIYCQREYSSPGRLRTHVLRKHAGTYRASAYLREERP